jgi:hypothetical protein
MTVRFVLCPYYVIWICDSVQNCSFRSPGDRRGNVNLCIHLVGGDIIQFETPLFELFQLKLREGNQFP